MKDLRVDVGAVEVPSASATSITASSSASDCFQVNRKSFW